MLQIPLSRFALVFGALLLIATGCSAPREDPSTAVGKMAILYKVNSALTNGDCDAAILGIESLYNSGGTDNQVRRLRASAHACKAGINFFPLITNLAAGSFSGSGLWRTITLLFPSTGTDGKTQASFYSTDALQAWLKTGTILSSLYKISGDPYNPGSVLVGDRTDDSNLYLSLVSMATIGTLHNTYGNPDPVTGAPGGASPLPWTSLAKMDEEGCGYASALLNLSDSLNSIGTTYTQLSGVSTAVGLVAAGFDAACDAACQVYCPTLQAAGGCTGKCPKTLRHRGACDRATPGTENVNACSAIGLVGLLNDPTAGWN